MKTSPTSSRGGIMGRLATVQQPFSGVALPSSTGVWQDLAAGQSVVLTEAEAVLSQVTNLVNLGAITLASANSSPEPVRPAGDKLAYANTFETQFTSASGGTVVIGSNVVTGPAAGVTYTAGFLTVAANSFAYGQSTGTQNIVLPANPGAGIFAPKTYSDPSIVNSLPQVGAVSGSLSELNVFHVQGAAASVAPTGKNWIANATVKWPGGTVPIFTASAGAIDYFQFVTYDGGLTYFNTLTVKGLA